ncbi:MULTISPECIES: hypothetical protein [unclassified Microbacterium]|uniref:hypothetical protein n=1 Tax=unclassified Microbacterium TaxID=2609290 RepID=UPI002883473D|nr:MULTISPECIES: hypothetical protein [unclassified Microbacterium]
MTRKPVVREALLDLADVDCDVRILRSLVGAPDDLSWTTVPSCISRVEATATLTSYDDTGDGERSVIAGASAYVVALDRTDDPVDALDHLDQEIFSVVEEIYRPSDSLFDMLEQKDEFLGSLVTQLVLVDNVTVEEAYRGQRLGPRLLTTLIDVVDGTGHSTLIVLRAQPLQWSELSELKLRRARKKVAASYEAVGFAHFRDNVYWRHNAFIGAESMESPDVIAR